jgi:hypothetical protein
MSIELTISSNYFSLIAPAHAIARLAYLHPLIFVVAISLKAFNIANIEYLSLKH